MTRFRAYSTSSDEEDDASVASSRDDSTEDESRVDDEIGSEPSEDDGEYLPSSLGDHGSDLSHLTDEAESSEDQQSEDEDNVRVRPSVQFDPTVRSQPPNVKAVADPTIIPWARELGVDAQKLHVMQTSLFRMPEEDAALKALSQQPTRRKTSAFTLLNRKHSRDSEGEGLRAGSRQRASFAQDIEPAPYRPSRKYARVEGSASAVDGNEGAFVDAGLAFGRSFRVGWGPGGTLIHLGSLCGPHCAPKTTANTSVVQKTVVPLVAHSIAGASERASKLLSHHLSSTPIEQDANGVPFADPSRHLSFASVTAQFPSNDRSFETSLFRLGRALFDPIDLRLADSVNIDIRNRVSHLRRKAALSSWLQDTIASFVDADLRDNPGADWATTVFTLLTGNQAAKACEVAMDGGNVKVASLISQYPGDEEYREDLRTQLALWREQRIDAHIGENTRKVYALLAGIVDVLEGSKGTGPEQCPDINIARDLNWKRAFGLHLWFGEPMDSSITDAFKSYDSLWKEPSAGHSPPVPWYKEQTTEETAHPSWVLPSSAHHPDALYSLIRLYADPTCSLSTILAPLSFSASPADYRLAWHLYIILSRCLRVRDFVDRESSAFSGDDSGANGNDEIRVEGHSPSADLLANSYALQLEQAGMIQEAVFVLLHIEGSAGRVKAIKELLGRSAARLDDWMTRGLVGSLKLPIAWVNEAKAIHALYSGNVYRAYELYLLAGLYNAAHELAVLELAPDAVIRQDLDLLSDLFDKFKGRPVDGWYVRGKAFLDYAHAMIRLPELCERRENVDAIPDAAEAAELEQLSRSVPKLIGILPDVLRDRSDPRHNAALSEMTIQLTKRLDRVKPLAIYQSQVRTSLMNQSTRIRNIQTTAYERFVRAIETA